MVELFKKTISKEMLFQMQRHQVRTTSQPPLSAARCMSIQWGRRLPGPGYEPCVLRGAPEILQPESALHPLVSVLQESGTSSPPARSSSRSHRTTSKLTAEALAQQQQQQQQRRSKLKGQQSAAW